MLEANSFAWTDVCLTLPKELTHCDTIAGPTTEVSGALETAATRARSNAGRSLAAMLQREMAARRHRDEFVRISPNKGQTAETPAASQPPR